MDKKNIFADIPKEIPQEIFEHIVNTNIIKIERIISHGHTSPENYWYDQSHNEWVLLLQGQAKILFAATEQLIIIKPGDYINIPAHQKHRVEWTDPNEPTIWLAIHY